MSRARILGRVGSLRCVPAGGGLAVLAALLALTLGTGARAQAAPTGGPAICAEAASGRLELHCRLGQAAGRAIGGAEFGAIAALARAQGRLERRIAGPDTPPRLIPFATPILRHESDINGGNPDRPLVLGNLVFTGDPGRVRRAGVVAGAEFGVALAHAAPPGLRLGLVGAWSGATDGSEGAGIRSARLSGCLERGLALGWFAELCAEARRTLRRFATTDTRATTLRVGRVFTAPGRTHAEAHLGVARALLDFAGQRRFLGGIDAIHQNGWHTGLHLMAGSAVGGRHAVRREAAGRIRIPVGARWVRIETNISAASGSFYFGVPRTETTFGATLVVPLTRALRLSAGYRRTRASIDYFASEGATFGIQFAPIPF